MQTYDLVIVGAGPAGSTAARYAAQNGLKVLVLERRRAIGQPVRCGEMLGDDIYHQYMGDDLSVVNKVIDQVDFIAPNKNMVRFRMKKLKYYMMERALFDQKLAELASADGAEIRVRCDVFELIKENDRVCGVKYNYNNEKIEVRCKAVIAADGVESRIAHLAGLSVVMKKRDVFSAWTAHVVSEKINTDTMQFIFDSELSPGGYIWVFPKGDKFANIGLGYIAKNKEEDNARKRLYDYLDKNCGDYSILTEYAGGVPASSPLEEPWAPGLFLTGDAARFTNSMTGGGIGSAMISGKYAGIYAYEAISTGKNIEELGKKYYKKLKSEFVNQYSLNYKFRKLILDDYEGIFNNWIDAAAQIPEEKRTMTAVMLKLFKAYPKYFPMYLKSWLFKGQD